MKQNKKYSLFQVVKVDNDIKNPCDFNGENSPLSIEAQEEFLDVQYKVYQETYGNKLSEKVASEKDVEKILADFEAVDHNEVRNRIVFKEFEASAIEKRNFEHLILYTKKTKAEKDKIIFFDCDNYPMPCAKIECGEGIKKFSFGINIDRSYCTAIRPKEKGILTGRCVSFRKDGQDVFILQFYSDGSFSAKLVEEDPYHPTIKEIGNFCFDDELILSVAFQEKQVVVTSENKEYSFVIEDLCPNEIFFGGGMFPIGVWAVRPIELQTLDGRDVNIFEPAVSNKIKETYIGTVSLPYGIGTEKYKDSVLKLKNEFDYVPNGKKTILNISTIDPDGEVFLNGKEIIGVSDYSYISVDVGKYLKCGKNILEIYVNPRAPEETYQWHKNKDPYCAWGAGVVYLDRVGETKIDSVAVITEKIKKKQNVNLIKTEFQVLVSATRGKDLKIEAFLHENGQRRKIAGDLVKTVKGQNEILLKAEFEGEPWSPENPYLYKIEILISDEERKEDAYFETIGFRTIEQSNGEFLLNGEPLIMRGALLMQFLPPYEETPINHVFPTDGQIVWQALLAKKMNCNTVRMHQLGYGTNDVRFARIFDRIGLICIWTTRLIDSLSTVLWKKVWKQSEFYREQMSEVINHPSICIWEGINEISMTLKDIDCAYKEFVTTVKKTDKTRLICPVSNLYYEEWYTDNGERNKEGKAVSATKEWNDPLVIRSAHPYVDYLGYGFSWSRLRNQEFTEQKHLLESKEHSYIMSEYAIIGRQDPTRPEALKYFNADSYEVANEYNLGYKFDKRWKLSQAYQALAAEITTKKALSLGADGVLWCSLNGGANDASYMKPPIDFYGYPKLAFFALKNYFNDIIFFSDDIETVWGNNYNMCPVIVRDGDKKIVNASIFIKDIEGNKIFEKKYEYVLLSERKTLLDPFMPCLKNGYYIVEYVVSEV